jgi:predicted RNase H-like HicB family nuclease
LSAKSAGGCALAPIELIVRSKVYSGGCYRTGYDEEVNLTIDLDREEDGRWIAEVLELSGVMCYGQTRDEAISNAERLAIEVIADRIAHGELPSSALGVSFTIPDELLARQ